MPLANPRSHKYKRRLDAFYINVIALLSRAKDDGIDIPLPLDGRFRELRSLPLDELLRFRDLCEDYAASGAISAVRINRIVDWPRVRPGITISMAHYFETNEIPDVILWPSKKPLPEGEVGFAFRDLANGWRLYMNIEPRWILNNSGALQFRTGRGYLTGLATVKAVAVRDSAIYSSPLILGL